MTNINQQIEQLNIQLNEINQQIESRQLEIDRYEYTITEDDFDEILDSEGECDTPVGKYLPSDILKYCDPIAYRCAKSDHESNMDLDDVEEYQDLQEEIAELKEQRDEIQDGIDDLESEIED